MSRQISQAYARRLEQARQTQVGDTWRNLKTGKLCCVSRRVGSFGVGLFHLQSGKHTTIQDHYLASGYEKVETVEDDDPPTNEAYLNPAWEQAGRVHDWRNYISQELRLMWETFTPAQRKALFENAEEIASREEWD